MLLKNERIDDVPLLLGMAQQLRLPQILEAHLGRHGLHRGLSPGQLATGWLAYILSQADHTKLHVRDWACSLAHTLGHFFAGPLRDTDFTDDRLGLVLRRLAFADWQALEADLFQATCDVYELPDGPFRLDSTTASGHHQARQGGLMQLGQSKDHRPDLAQLKLMAAACEPAGQLVLSGVHPGNCADDPLYVPLIDRLDRLLGKKGLLFTGDCKMTSLATRAFVVGRGQHYLAALARNGNNGQQIDGWVDDLLAGRLARQELYDGQRYLGLAGQFSRPMSASAEGKEVSWVERVQLLRPEELHLRQRRQLHERLAKAEEALWRLTPQPGVGKKQIRDQAGMEQAAAGVLKEHRVEGLLRVSWERQESRQLKQVGPGRRGPGRATREVVKVRYQLTGVSRDEGAIAAAIQRLGWRVQVTSLAEGRLGLLGCVLGYRQGWCLEQDFSLVKNRPLGLSPLWVWKEDQLEGLSRLLTIALRLLTLLQLRARQGLRGEEEALKGTYAGQAGRKDKRPTGLRLLGALARAQITLTGVEKEGEVVWRLGALPELLGKLLRWLGLPTGLYSDLASPADAGPASSAVASPLDSS
jgi:transposase